MLHNKIETHHYLFQNQVPVEVTYRDTPLIHVRFPSMKAGFYTNIPWKGKESFAYADPIELESDTEKYLFQYFFGCFSLLKNHVKTDIPIFNHEFFFMKKQLKNLMDAGLLISVFNNKKVKE